MSSKEKEIQQLVLHKFNQNQQASGRSIAKSLKLPQSTVNCIIKRYKGTNSVGRKPGGGRKPGSHNKELVRKVVRSIEQNPRLSDSERAQRYDTSRFIVRRIRLRAGYKSYRVIKHPNRSDKQSLVAKQRARLLYDQVLTKHGGCVIMDDETYVKLDFKQIPANNYYVAKFRGRVMKRFKYILQDKFAKKLLIWQAICSCGQKSKVFVSPSTLTADLYIKECLEKRLLPMIRKHNCSIIFWPDLASCHYAKKTLEWFRTHEVAIVDKQMNPPNCPQLRPIEIYWAIVKRKLNKTGGVARNAQDLRRKWNACAEKVSERLVQELMGGVNRKTREFIRSKDL